MITSLQREYDEGFNRLILLFCSSDVSGWILLA